MTYDVVDFAEVATEIWAVYKLENGEELCRRVVAIGHLEWRDDVDDECVQEVVLLRHDGEGGLVPVRRVAGNEVFAGLVYGKRPPVDG